MARNPVQEPSTHGFGGMPLFFGEQLATLKAKLSQVHLQSDILAWLFYRLETVSERLHKVEIGYNQGAICNCLFSSLPNRLQTPAATNHGFVTVYSDLHKLSSMALRPTHFAFVS